MQISKKIVSIVASELETSGSAEGGSQDMLLQPHTQVSQDIQQAVFTYLDSELSGDSRRDTEFVSRIKETLFNVSSKIPIEQLKEVLKATVACYALEKRVPTEQLQTVLDRFYGIREEQISEASKLDRTSPTEMPLLPTSSSVPPTKKLLINADHDRKVQIPGDWVSRKKDEEKLVGHLKDEEVQIIELSMIGGSGKSTCIRNLIDELDKIYGVNYEQVIWYAFYHLRSKGVLAPFREFLDFVIEKAGLKRGRRTEDKKKVVMRHLQRHKILVVLDGLEIAQEGGRTDDEKIISLKAGEEGEFKDPGFRDFMREMVHQSRSKIIVTTRLPMRDLRTMTGVEKGVVAEELSEWTEDEVKDYLGGVSREEDIPRIRQVLGSHPLTMVLFKVMATKTPGMDVEEFLCSMELEISQGSGQCEEGSKRETYEGQCNRIKRMIKELKDVLSEEGWYFMEQVGLMYGSIDYEDREIVQLRTVSRERRDQWWWDAINDLGRLGLIKPDKYKRRVAAHPMVKVGFRALMEGDEKIRRRGEIMEHYEGKNRGRRQGAPLDMDGVMEWGHQLTKIVDEGGEGRLDELYQRYKVEMRQLEYSELGRRIKREMGELIAERRSVSVEEEKGSIVKDDPERERVFERESGGGEMMEAEEVLGLRVEGGRVLRGTSTRVEVGRSRSYEEEKRRSVERLRVKAEGIRGRLSDADMRDVSRWGEIYKACLEGKEFIREMAEEEELGPEINKLEREMEAVVGYSVYVRMLYRTEGEQVAERARGLMGAQFTGEEEWEKIFGEEPEGIPELPEEMVGRLEQLCPFDPSKKVSETHILYCVPGKLRRKELNIVEWERVMREGEHKGMKGGKLYDNVWYKDERFAKEGISGTEGDERGEWVLMPKFMVPGSTNKGWEGQERMVRDNYGAQGYEVVRALEVVSGVMVNYLRTGERLYEEGYKVKRMKDGKEYPYVNTKDRTSAGGRVYVGPFLDSGLDVTPWDGLPHKFIGVAVCCRFVGHKK